MNWQALEHRMRNELHDHQSFDLEEASLWSAIEAQMEPPMVQGPPTQQDICIP